VRYTCPADTSSLEAPALIAVDAFGEPAAGIPTWGVDGVRAIATEAGRETRDARFVANRATAVAIRSTAR
jgi:hypothetical protein